MLVAFLRTAASTIVAATIIALGLMFGAFRFGGVYESHTGGKGMVIYHVNRFTGATALALEESTLQTLGSG